MTESEFAASAAEPEATSLVPVEVHGHRIMLSVREVGSRRGGPADEHEIAARAPKLEQMLDGVAVFAKEIAERMQDTDASRITVEFGCEIAVESGAFIAVIGKASGKSTLTVGLEWVKPQT